MTPKRFIAAAYHSISAGFPCSHERVGDTVYFYCRDGHGLMKKLLELDLPNTLNRPATLEDVFLKLTGRSLHE